MKRARFVIVGSGWRSLYFVRIAKALPERFELCGMLCRTEEKAERIANEYGIHTTISIEECIALQPDFIICAVNRANNAAVTLEWLRRGFPVLSETPAADDPDTLCEMWAMHQRGAKLVIAEQYTHYPTTLAALRMLETGVLGTPSCLNLSMAHEYHGASLMRAFLQVKVGTPFSISARSFKFPTTESQNRYERFTDGRIADKVRTVADIVFDDGRVAFYDFDSEQYRSPIRPNHLKLQGVRGTLLDGTVYHLDEENQPVIVQLKIESRKVVTESDNPNLHAYDEVTRVSFTGTTCYTPPFGLCGLSEDETAIAMLMDGMAAYARGESEAPYSLAEGLEDAYTAILMARSIACGQTLHSEPMPWHD